MKTIGLLFLVCVTAFGQRAGVRGGGGGSIRPYPYGSVSGFGNSVFPGTGHAPRVTFTGTGGGVQFNFGHGSSLRGVRGGNIVYMPYPVYPIGASMYYGQQEPPVSAMYPPPQAPPAPQVVINQNFAPETARPVVREYPSDPDAGVRAQEQSRSYAASAEENPTYLIAFKDHTIYAALAYWVEGDTLHYVTNQNTHNQVSLDLIDRDLSNRFNRERNVDFRLPPAR